MNRIRPALTLILLSVLTACSTPGQPPNEVVLRGSVEGWVQGRADVAAVFRAAASAETASGTIGSDGSLEVTLATSVPGNVLDSVPSCADAVPSAPNARMNSFSALEVSGGSTAGMVAQANAARVLGSGLTEVGDYYVLYSYADRDVTVTGVCPLGGLGASFRYDLELQAGWNAVLFRLEQAGANGETIALVSEEPPAGAGWFYQPAP